MRTSGTAATVAAGTAATLTPAGGVNMWRVTVSAADSANNGLVTDYPSLADAHWSMLEHMQWYGDDCTNKATVAKNNKQAIEWRGKALAAYQQVQWGRTLTLMQCVDGAYLSAPGFAVALVPIA